MLQQNSPTFLAFKDLFYVKRRTCSRIFHSLQLEETSMSLCQIGLVQRCNNNQLEKKRKENGGNICSRRGGEITHC